jgi:hypothetical protein
MQVNQKLAGKGCGSIKTSTSLEVCKVFLNSNDFLNGAIAARKREKYLLLHISRESTNVLYVTAKQRFKILSS